MSRPALSLAQTLGSRIRSVSAGLVVLAGTLAVAAVSSDSTEFMLLLVAAMVGLAGVAVLLYGPAAGDGWVTGLAILGAVWVARPGAASTDTAAIQHLATLIGAGAIWLATVRLARDTSGRERTIGFLTAGGLVACTWLVLAGDRSSRPEAALQSGMVFTVFALLAWSRLLQVTRRTADAPLGLWERFSAVLRASTVSALLLIVALTGVLLVDRGTTTLLVLLAGAVLGVQEAAHWPTRPASKRPIAVRAGLVSGAVLAALAVVATHLSLNAPGVAGPAQAAAYGDLVWTLMADTRWMGLGFGHFDWALAGAVTPETRAAIAAGQAVDTALTRWIAETGLLGLLAGTAALVGLYRVTTRPLRLDRGSPSPALLGLAVFWLLGVSILIDLGVSTMGFVWVITAVLAYAYANGAITSSRRTAQPD